MLGHFDREKFSDLLIKAKGNRNTSSFAKDSGVSKNQISLWLRQKSDFTPKEESLKKIAITAQNGVTYEELLDACGYLPSPEEQAHFNAALKQKTLIKENDEIFCVNTLENIITPEDTDDFKEIAHTVISFVQENQVSKDELYQCLVMLRALKQNKK